MAQVYSIKFRPKNRVNTGLGVLDIEVRDGQKTLTLDPNKAAMLGFTGKLPVQDPVGPSVLSGAPGYCFRTSEVELVLTREELLRLFRRSLEPREVQMLLNQYGAFHEIHSDFYDEDTFEALQPMD